MFKERVLNYSIGSFVILIGLIVLAGWVWDVPALRMVLLPDNVSMKVNVAVCLILSGIILMSLRPDNHKSTRRFLIVLSFFIFLIAAVSLSQDVFNYFIGIDELFVKDKIARSHQYAYPGRMAAATAICLCLEAIGFIGLFCSRPKCQIIAQYCFHGVTVLSFITILGYIFSVPALYQMPYMPVMAIHTSVCLFLLSIGASSLQPSMGIAHLFLADRLGSRMARRVFPVVTVAVLILGSTCVRLHRYGVAEVEVGIMVCVFIFLLTGLYFICRTAKWLNGIERERNTSDKTIRQLYNELEKKIVERSAALNSSEANLRTILDTTDTVYALVDSNLKVVSFNQCAYEFAKNELHFEAQLGKPITDYFPKGREESVAKLVSAAMNGQSISYESRYLQPDNSLNWYDVKVCPVCKNKDEVLGLMVAITNITERKNNEMQSDKITNELIQRNKALEQFTYMVSHNLRAPLANIMGLSSILMEHELSEADSKEVIEGIATSSHRLDNVIKDLNDILQVKEGAKEKKELVYFSQMVNEVKQLLGYLADEVRIKTDFSKSDSIHTLKSYINSVFYNLISNAIKYRRQDVASVIEIYSEVEGPKLILHFKDNGIGIDMARNADNIFGLYNRFHQHTEGKGMGLFMVKTQLETLGGTIDVDSEVNKGTQFRIELPIE